MSIYERAFLDLNNLDYCRLHTRDICHECTVDTAWSNGVLGGGFKIPENGIPEYPQMLNSIRDPTKRYHIGQRWLELQKAVYTSKSSASEASSIKFAANKSRDEDTPSGLALQKELLRVFHQLQGLTSSQRYYWGNQSRIMMEDYDTFMEAAVLYEQELNDLTARGLGELPDGMVPGARVKRILSKANTLSKFGFFLELNTLRSFWRTMEITADAFTMHVEKYDEEADSHVGFTEKARVYLLQWLSHIYWLQHEVYQRRKFPFYPVNMPAMVAGRDVHLIIAKLSTARLTDMPGFASLLMQFREAGEFTEQMKDVNAEVMAAIDELSTRFRFLEEVMSAALLVTSEDEIKGALGTYKFASDAKEINSKTDDVAAIITQVNEGDERPATKRRCSHLQKLMVKENTYRQAHAARFMRAPFTEMTSNQFTKKMFEEFKSMYSVLYYDNIRKLWKEDEFSLLPMDVARRRQHRLDVKKKKKKKTASVTNYADADMAETRSVPESAFTDPSLLWEVGNGAVEKYVLPVVREKVKTRKQVISNEEYIEQTCAGSSTSEESVADQDVKELGVPLRRPLDNLKKSDVVTRDLLWRKVKGSLKWSDLVQFLTRLGCRLFPEDGSKRKIVDPLTGRWTLLHRPHPGDECRPDQRESYRIHIEDWLDIKYSDLEGLDEIWETK